MKSFAIVKRNVKEFIFDKLETGEVFEYAGQFYMRIAPPKGDAVPVAVELDSGKTKNFHPADVVIPVKTEIICTYYNKED